MPTDKSEAGVRAAFEAWVRSLGEDDLVGNFKWDGFPSPVVAWTRASDGLQMGYKDFSRQWSGFQAALATSAADSERLDWLERDARPGSFHCWVITGPCWEWLGHPGPERLRYETLREAIDAAMLSEAKSSEMQAEEQQRAD